MAMVPHGPEVGHVRVVVDRSRDGAQVGSGGGMFGFEDRESGEDGGEGDVEAFAECCGVG